MLINSTYHKEHPSLDPNSWFNDSADDENAVYQTLRTLQELKESQKKKIHKTKFTISLIINL